MKTSVIVAAILLVVFVVIAPCRAQASLSDSADLAGVLAGIVHFTHWPEAHGALRVCVDRADERSTGLGDTMMRALAERGADRREIVIVARSTASIDELLDCQAVYFGAAPASVYRPMLVKLAGRPILTIGQGEEFCSFGGLFCLEPSSPSARIKANLDSIAASGLRVNPQLLRLTQRPAELK